MANRSAPGAKGGATCRPMTRGAVAISVSFAATGSGCAAATGKEAAAAAAVAAAAAGTAEDTDDGRLSERLARLQQEQLQQVPRGLRVQGLEPPSLSLPANPRVPIRTDHCDREDEHPPALPAPAMGQKERCQKERPRTGGGGGRELSATPQGGPDRQPRHARGHLGPTQRPTCVCSVRSCPRV